MLFDLLWTVCNKIDEGFGLLRKYTEKFLSSVVEEAKAPLKDL